MEKELPQRGFQEEIQISAKKKRLTILILAALTLVLAFFSLFIGSGGLTFAESWQAIFRQGDEVNIRIVYLIRMKRMLAALIAGAGLSFAGLLMQTTLRNPMASPGTLGVSNAAVLGANIAIIVLSGGYFDSNHGSNWNATNPYGVSSIAFIFAFVCILLVLGISKIRNFSPNTVILAGIGLGALYQAITAIIQYFATDTQLTSAVYWSFGDLGRASYEENIIMLVSTLPLIVIFSLFSMRLNALSGGEEFAKSLGINTSLLRFLSLLAASFITAVCVSILGIIGFIGIIAPHIMRMILGGDHRYLIPSSCLCGSSILLISGMLSDISLAGAALPVGAVTSLIGAPFFLFIIFRKKEARL